MPCGAIADVSSDDSIWFEVGHTISAEVLPGKDVTATSLKPATPLVPAATVIVDVAQVAEFESVTLFSASGEGLFERSVAKEEWGKSLSVPVGNAFVLIRDRSGEVTRLTLPAPVVRSSVTRLRPEIPDSTSLVALLGIPDGFVTATPRELSVAFQGDARQTADYLLAGTRQSIAIWMDLSDRRGTLHAASHKLLLSPQTVALRPGRLTTIKAELTRRPRLRIEVDAKQEGGGTASRAMSVAVYGSDGSLAVSRTLEDSSTVLDDLPAEVLRVVLSVGRMKFQRMADLRLVPEVDVRFELIPIEITGRVFLGDELATASLRFLREGVDPVKTTSEGRYSVTLWEPGPVVVEISLDDDQGQQPFSELHRIDKSKEIDFHIPTAVAQFAVTDAVTKLPIQDARISLKNGWEEGNGKRSVSQQATTDVEGRARSPRLRPGTLEIRVSAKGYRFADPISLPVTDTTSEQVIPLTLHPQGPTQRRQVLLADGTPAAGARLRLVEGSKVLAFETAKADGFIELPETSAGFVIASHPAGAVTLWPWGEGNLDAPLRMNPRGAPLAVRAVDSKGESAGSAAVYVWINGVRLGGAVLGTVMSPITTAWGTWEVADLPASPVRILITKAPTNAVLSGAFDSLAVTIPYPWGEAVDLRVAD